MRTFRITEHCSPNTINLPDFLDFSSASSMAKVSRRRSEQGSSRTQLQVIGHRSQLRSRRRLSKAVSSPSLRLAVGGKHPKAIAGKSVTDLQANPSYGACLRSRFVNLGKFQMNFLDAVVACSVGNLALFGSALAIVRCVLTAQVSTPLRARLG